MVDVLDVIRNMVDSRPMSAVGGVALRLRQARSQGRSSFCAGGGGIVSTGGRVDRNVDRDAISVVCASHMGHGGCGAAQGEHAEAHEVGQLHDDGWSTDSEDHCQTGVDLIVGVGLKCEVGRCEVLQDHPSDRCFI